ncbi:MAG: hypothetical protein HY459_01475 [Parcubacteria group bacterium]|nr:hypothetical protein [Parcubacteria group bacterium]
MNYLVVCERNGKMLWRSTLAEAVAAALTWYSGSHAIYETTLTRRRPKFVLVDRRDLIRTVSGRVKWLVGIRNPYRDKIRRSKPTGERRVTAKRASFDSDAWLDEAEEYWSRWEDWPELERARLATFAALAKDREAKKAHSAKEVPSASESASASG